MASEHQSCLVTAAAAAAALPLALPGRHIPAQPEQHAHPPSNIGLITRVMKKIRAYKRNINPIQTHTP